MSEMIGPSRNKDQSRSRELATKLARQIMPRVCAAAIIDLLAPHMPGIGPHTNDVHPGICIANTRT